MSLLTITPMLAGATIVGATVTQLSADTLYISVGLAVTVCGAVFWIGRKLSEIEVQQDAAHEHRVEMRKELADVTAMLTKTHEQLMMIEVSVSRLPCVVGRNNPTCEKE